MPIRLDTQRARLIAVELADSGAEARAKKLVRTFENDPTEHNRASALAALAMLDANRIAALKAITFS